MSRIIPFSKCIARPNIGDRSFYLSKHLEGARELVRSFFPSSLGTIPQLLLELGAVCHDITKAHIDWQEYVQGKRQTGPNHSGSGAILFSYISYSILKEMNEWNNLENQLLWMLITRDIADHHGVLKGYAKNLEIEKGSFEKLDLTGIQQWLNSLFPQYSILLKLDRLNEWQYELFEEITEDVIDKIYDYYREEMCPLESMMEILQRWRFFTAILISSDRFDILPIYDDRFTEKNWLDIQAHIERFCQEGKNQPLTIIRVNAQKKILEQWKEHQHSHFFVLEMPTGYGKTLTALKLANEIGKREGYSKIIYVAPYLSILEQNAEFIKKAINHAPLSHHSMAIIDEKVILENQDSDENLDLIIQSWSNPIICTSFVQWMKAIFPKRAQDTLRRIFLQKSIIIIDEPQIISATIWNLFLKGLEALVQIYDCKVIFCSATMPPLHYGLKQSPVILHVSPEKQQERYQINVLSEDVDRESCVNRLLERNEPTAAVILNTIQDSIEVFDLIPNDCNIEKYLLHGLMIPLHKTIQLKKILEQMVNLRVHEPNKKIRVVSSQIIEAGVDFSFHYLFRALPILPSLIQAAGRVNRHGELETGIIEVAKYTRNSKDTRFVYGKELCKITDELLFSKDTWYESEMESLIKQYYDRMFEENRYETILLDIERAFLGGWETLSQHDVFKRDHIHRLPIFIPFPVQSVKAYVPNSIINLMEKFNVQNAEDIYELFLSKSLRREWSYNKNRQFHILFNQFIVNVPVEKAIKLIPKDEFLSKGIPILDDYSYSLEKGLVIDTIDDFLI